MERKSKLGAMIGCAVGDALGLPYEALTKRRGIRLLGEPDRHRFVFRRGMVSDDTEHTCMVGQALCASPGNPDMFASQLARRLRWWLLGLPAGIGSATLRSILKLWLGFSPSRSGVYSAGNGPAMRSAILGAAIDDLQELKRFVNSSTRITHTDPKAFHGALAVGIAAWCAKRGIHQPSEFVRHFDMAADHDTSDEFRRLLARIETSLACGDSTEHFAEQIGCKRGVSGYVYQTVPVALHCWLRHHQDYRTALPEIIRCGGDTDTTAAIVGAIIGSNVGVDGIPAEWVNNVWAWPQSVEWMQRLSAAVEQAVRTTSSVAPPRIWPLVTFPRNMFFLAVVLVHVLRRLLPPY